MCVSSVLWAVKMNEGCANVLRGRFVFVLVGGIRGKTEQLGD